MTDRYKINHDFINKIHIIDTKFQSKSMFEKTLYQHHRSVVATWHAEWNYDSREFYYPIWKRQQIKRLLNILNKKETN